MNSHTFAEAVAEVSAALAPVGVPIHNPPMPTRPVAAPCLLIGLPDLTDMIGTCTPPVIHTTVDVMVVAGDPNGTQMVALIDDTIAAAAAAGLRVTSTAADVYDPGTTPGPLPAARLTLE